MANALRIVANSRRAMDKIATHDFRHKQGAAEDWANQARTFADGTQPGQWVVRVSSFKLGSRQNPSRMWQVHVYQR